jgi:hypothetical protein
MCHTTHQMLQVVYNGQRSLPMLLTRLRIYALGLVFQKNPFDNPYCSQVRMYPFKAIPRVQLASVSLTARLVSCSCLDGRVVIAHRNTLRKGGVFFFTRDGAYMIKTIKVSEISARISVACETTKARQASTVLTLMLWLYGQKEEARTLLKMLPKYHKYMNRNGRRSLLTRFCGMYGVSLGTSGTSTSR